MQSIVENFKTDALLSFRKYKKLADRALEQITDEDFFRQIDPESNSIATIVKHIAGNMRSRWRDFLTTDGEKPDRDRDSEFERPPASRDELLRIWEDGWRYVFAAIEPLTEADLTRTITIRGEPHSVTQAINRAQAHYAGHIGQIVFLAKHFKSTEWKTLTIPRHRS